MMTMMMMKESFSCAGLPSDAFRSQTSPSGTPSHWSGHLHRSFRSQWCCMDVEGVIGVASRRRLGWYSVPSVGSATRETECRRRQQ